MKIINLYMSKYLCGVIYYLKDWKILLINVIIALFFLELIGEIFWLICWNGCAHLYMWDTVWEVEGALNATRLVAIPAPCNQQLNRRPSWENGSFIPYSFLVMDKFMVWPKGVRDQLWKAEIILTYRRNLYVGKLFMLAFFLIFQGTLNLTIKCNVTENAAIMATPQDRER